ncbi:MAG: nuclear transport factor 2 family protein [Cytophagales bacterium]|nr:nuclear transport factor 2 family protein [Cytophagales bacterium]
MKKCIYTLLVGILVMNANAQTTSDTNINTSNTEKMSNQEQELKSFNDFKDIVEALQSYIESARTGDGKLGTSVFYEHTQMVGSVDGQISYMPISEFGNALSQMGPSENVQHQIAWIDISGPAAAARVEFINWGGFRFTDFLILYKENDQWKISGKVFNSHSRN